jgi:NAD(P)-dependent dehydrogenase (short-subunit alcohol dehydrogenase family)
MEMGRMTSKPVWIITGAGRGLAIDIAKASPNAGHAVVATGRITAAVERALGDSEHLLVLKMDVTQPADAEEASRNAVERFGRIGSRAVN